MLNLFLFLCTGTKIECWELHSCWLQPYWPSLHFLLFILPAPVLLCLVWVGKKDSQWAQTQTRHEGGKDTTNTSDHLFFFFLSKAWNKGHSQLPGVALISRIHEHRPSDFSIFHHNNRIFPTHWFFFLLPIISRSRLLVWF